MVLSLVVLMPKENVAAGLVVSVAPSVVLRPKVKVDWVGSVVMTSCWLCGTPNVNACLLLSAPNLNVLGPKAEVETGDCPFERSIAWSLASAAPGAREPHAMHVWKLALLRTKQVSHSQDPLGGWNMPAKEDVTGVAVVDVLGISLTVESFSCPGRCVEQATHSVSFALLCTRQALHSQEPSALGNREARDRVVGAATVVDPEGFAVPCSGDASCLCWAFSNASLNASAWKR